MMESLCIAKNPFTITRRLEKTTNLQLVEDAPNAMDTWSLTRNFAVCVARIQSSLCFSIYEVFLKRCAWQKILDHWIKSPQNYNRYHQIYKYKRQKHPSCQRIPCAEYDEKVASELAIVQKYEGKDYYFCCNGCRRIFLKKPRKWKSKD